MARLDQKNARYDTQGGETVGTAFELDTHSYVYFLVLSYVKYIRGNVGQTLELLSYNDARPNYELIAYSSISARGYKEASDSRVSSLLYLPPGSYAWRSRLLYSEQLGEVQQIGDGPCRPCLAPPRVDCAWAEPAFVAAVALAYNTIEYVGIRC